MHLVSEQQTAFYELKRHLVQDPVLTYPCEEGTFILDTDASDHGVGAVLSKEQEEERESDRLCQHSPGPHSRGTV